MSAGTYINYPAQSCHVMRRCVMQGVTVQCMTSVDDCIWTCVLQHLGCSNWETSMQTSSVCYREPLHESNRYWADML